MCAYPQSNWLNTIAVRASYILSILKRFPWGNQEKPGDGLSPPGKKTKTETNLSFLVFG